MGEIADDHYDQIMNSEWGFRSRPRAYRPPASSSCNSCGAGNLKWQTDHRGKWVLYEKNRDEQNRPKPHVCADDQPNAEGFDDVG